MSEQKCENAYFEGQTGPDLEYSYLAEVSFEPNAKGLDDGRIQYLSVTEIIVRDFSDAPSFESGDYEAWLGRVTNACAGSSLPGRRTDDGRSQPARGCGCRRDQK